MTDSEKPVEVELIISPASSSRVPADPLIDSVHKLDRGRAHAIECIAHTAKWADALRDRPEPVYDPKTGTTSYHFSPLADIDPAIRLTAADALHNYRSALDQAISICCRLMGNSPKDSFFPTGHDLRRFEANLAKQVPKLPAPVIACLRELEPYYGGRGELLRALHDLNNEDKHNNLISTEFSIQQAHLTVDEDGTNKLLSLGVTITFAGVPLLKNVPIAQALEDINAAAGTAFLAVGNIMGRYFYARSLTVAAELYRG